MAKYTVLAFAADDHDDFIDVLKSQCQCYEDHEDDVRYECIVCSAIAQIDELEAEVVMLQREADRLEALCKTHGIDYEDGNRGV